MTRTLAVPPSPHCPLSQPHGAAIVTPSPPPSRPDAPAMVARARRLLAEIEALPPAERWRHRGHEAQVREMLARVPEVRT